MVSCPPVASQICFARFAGSPRLNHWVTVIGLTPIARASARLVLKCSTALVSPEDMIAQPEYKRLVYIYKPYVYIFQANSNLESRP